MPELFALTQPRQQAFDDALDQLAEEGRLGVSLPFFSPDEITMLILQATRLPMRKARAKVGAPGREVPQDFDICFPAPREDALDHLAVLLEAAVAHAAVPVGISASCSMMRRFSIIIKAQVGSAFTVMRYAIEGLFSSSRLQANHASACVMTGKVMVPAP